MTTPVSNTKGDRVEMIVTDMVNRARSAVESFGRHPDEFGVCVAPTLLLFLATHRHRLSLLEQLMISEAGVLLGELLVEKYRSWKTQPAGPAPSPLKVA